MKLLIVEDDKRLMESYKDTIHFYNKDNENRKIECVECEDIGSAIEKIDNSLDCAIIDLILDKKLDAGEGVIDKIRRLNLRLPIIILTGMSGAVDEPKIQEICLEVYDKAHKPFIKILEELWDIYSTGITRIVGGRGKIEEHLNKVMQHSIFPNIGMWSKYTKAKSDTENSKVENAMLRYTLSHLMQLIDNENESVFPEEFYILRTNDDTAQNSNNPPKTGYIVSKNNQKYVVMSPACDLAIRIIRDERHPKTNRILLVEIEDEGKIAKKRLGKIKTQTKREAAIRELLKNNFTDYYHWLPKIDLHDDNNSFNGGFMNFRKLSALPWDEFYDKFTILRTQIAPPFIKDIVSRFSSYYARQGQPDIKLQGAIDRLCPPCAATG